MNHNNVNTTPSAPRSAADQGGLLDLAAREFAGQSSCRVAWITVSEAAARSGVCERTIRYNCSKWAERGLAKRFGSKWLLSPLADERFLPALPAASPLGLMADLLTVVANSLRSLAAASGRAPEASK